MPAQAAETAPKSESQTQASTTDNNKTGKIAIRLNGKAGSVTITDQDNKTVKATVGQDGKGTVTKKDGSQADATIDKDGTIYTYNETVGDQLTVTVEPVEGYKAASFKITSDSGAKAVSDNKSSFSVEEGSTVISATFDKQDDTQSKKVASSEPDNKEDGAFKDVQGRYKVADNIVIDKATSKAVDKLVASGESTKQAWKDVVNPGTYTAKKVKAKLAATNIEDHDFSVDGIYSSTFSVHDGNKTYTGFCIEAAISTPIHYKGAYNKVTVQANNFNAKMATAILAYGVGGEHSDFIARIIPNAGQQKVAMMQALRQYAQGGHDQTARKAYTNNFINAIKTQVVDKGLIADTSYYYVWAANGYQNVAAGYNITPPEGYATAHKASSNTAISGGNAQYSLDGAEYRIYSDQGCTKYTGKGFHFDANGNNTWGNQKLTPGTYYAKEYKAPKGFKADSTVYKFNVTSGNTTNNPVKVDIKENPDYGTLSFQKLDAETGKATPQKGTLDGKNTTFKDAQYTFTYSDGAKKTYTWVMKTDENGKIEWDDAHYVSGDKLIKNDDKAVIPLGTVTYKETKAPAGLQPGSRFPYRRNQSGQQGISQNGIKRHHCPRQHELDQNQDPAKRI